MISIQGDHESVVFWLYYWEISKSIEDIFWGESRDSFLKRDYRVFWESIERLKGKSKEWKVYIFYAIEILIIERELIA